MNFGNILSIFNIFIRNSYIKYGTFKKHKDFN